MQCPESKFKISGPAFEFQKSNGQRLKADIYCAWGCAGLVFPISVALGTVMQDIRIMTKLIIAVGRFRSRERFVFYNY
jgi:hypothetical protein